MDREPHSLNVLVADATAVGRQLAAFLFGKRGHTVRAVATAADLLARLDPPPDLVVVRLPLPAADPAALARDVRLLAPAAVLFAIASDSAEGFDGTLSPPLDPAKVDAALAQLDPPAVDVPRLMAMVENNYDLLRKMLEALEPTVESGLVGLKVAIAANDQQSLIGLAHRLKGGLGNLAADQAVAAAKAMEDLGKAGNLGAAPAALATLDAAARRVLAELRELASKS